MRKSDKLISNFVISILCIFLVLVAGKIVVKNVLYEKLHIDNALIAFVLSDDSEYLGTSDPLTYVNYAKLYPFKENTQSKKDTLLDKFVSKFSKIQDTFSTYASEKLLFRLDLIKAAYVYEDLIGMNGISMLDESAVVELREGHLTALNTQKDMQVAGENLVEFSRYIESTGAEFLYVQIPYKISESETSLSAMYQDYSNEDANELLTILEDNQVNTLDLRKAFDEKFGDFLPLFYKTDHHWKIETGLEAASILANYLNQNYDFEMKLENLEISKYKTTTYDDSFLGSRGRKVTLARTELEDIAILTPEYETSMCTYIPDRSIDVCGSFEETLMDESKLGREDYYDVSPYHTYAYGDRPIIEIENELVNNGKKILIIRDSFSVPMVPFMALSTESIHSLDLRYFKGSVESYIVQYQPDMVIVAYNPSVFVDSKQIEYTTHTNMFDFK